MNQKNVWSLSRPYQTHSHNLHFKITGLARRFFPETVFNQNTLLLYNPKECRGKKFVLSSSLRIPAPCLLLENPIPLFPWGPLDFLSTWLGIDSLTTSCLIILFTLKHNITLDFLDPVEFGFCSPLCSNFLSPYHHFSCLSRVDFLQ